jgi:hypothetical protein
MATIHEELKAEEAELSRLLKAKKPQDAAATDRLLKAMRSKAQRVKTLRALAQRPPAEEHMRALAARREIELEQKAKREESRRREPGRKAARRLLAFAHPELIGATLDSSRLDVAEGEELFELVEQRLAGTLSGRKEKRYERLVGTLAGEPALFERKRQERDAADAEAKAADLARLEAMPVRRYEGKGGVYLPPLLYSWLTRPKRDGLNVADLGILAAILFAFEHGRSPFVRSEIIDSAILLDPAAPFQFLPYLDPDSELAPRRVREAVRYFADGGWLELDTADGKTRIRLGERARRQLDEAASAVT